MSIEIKNALMERIRSNKSVKAIWDKSVCRAYEAYRSGDSCLAEYLEEQDYITWKCSLMVEG